MASARAVTQKVSLSQDDFGIPRSLNAHTTLYITQSAVISKSKTNGYVSTNALRRARGGIIGPNGPMGFAEGGMVRGGPQLVTVAEEGTPEMIIPLGSQRRQRGMQLWRKAGHMLGVEGFADGGIAGCFGRMAEPSNVINFPFRTNESLSSLTEPSSFQTRVINFPDPDIFKLPDIRPVKYEPEPLPRKESNSGSSNNVNINLGDINVTLQIEVNGAKGEDVVSSVEKNKRTIADMISGEILNRMKDVFINTPLRGGETA